MAQMASTIVTHPDVSITAGASVDSTEYYIGTTRQDSSGNMERGYQIAGYVSAQFTVSGAGTVNVRSLIRHDKALSKMVLSGASFEVATGITAGTYVVDIPLILAPYFSLRFAETGGTSDATISNIRIDFQ